MKCPGGDLHETCRSRITELEEDLARRDEVNLEVLRQRDQAISERDAAVQALADEWPDLDALPEWTPEQRADMDAEYAAWVVCKLDARKDTERINWLETYVKSGAQSGLMTNLHANRGPHKTLRKAIDAARAAQQPPEETREPV